MQNKIMFIITLVFIIGLLSYTGFAQNQTEPPPDPCEGVTCEGTTTVCPDGVEVSCSNSCSDGTCSSCTPDCSGHEAVDPCEGVTCGDSTAVCGDGTEARCSNACTDGVCSSCKPDCSGREQDLCAVILCQDSVTVCPDGAEVFCQNICSKGECSSCVPDCTGHETGNYCGDGFCNNNEDEFSCPTDCGFVDPYCGDGSCDIGEDNGNCPGDCFYDIVCGDNICESGEEFSCPGDCGPGGQEPYCGDGICDFEKGEDTTSCSLDCGSGECEPTFTCYNGQTVRLISSGQVCIYEPCSKEIPPGCYEDFDEQGSIIVKCDTTCPAIPPDVRDRCFNSGGSPVVRTDSSGCEFIECDFQGGGGTPIKPPTKCPSPAEIQTTLNKCEEIELKGVIKKEGGCDIAKCIKEKEDECPYISFEDRKRMEFECESGGRMLWHEYDENGCDLVICKEKDNFCRQKPPPEAYKKCSEAGGEFIVRTDDHGCVAFEECITRGDDVYLDPIDELPDITILLNLALKLDSLKIKFEELAQKTDDIADYFESQGASDEERYRRVSDIFRSALYEVDDIKLDLRERVEFISIPDLNDIKFRIQELKDRIMKDAIYLLLSASDEVRDIGQSGSDCGTDGGCFDRAFRVCEPIDRFLPEGRNGPIVSITGLDGNACVLHVEMPPGQGPPGVNAYMDCKIEKYALGIRDPDKDVLPFCEGPLVDFMGDHGRGGPGGCTSDRECDEFCRNNPEECMRWCDENPGMCPDEPRRDFDDFERPEFESEFERRDFERDEFGNDFERRSDNFREFEQREERCGGCLDNDICDPGECSYCFDCSRR